MMVPSRYLSRTLCVMLMASSLAQPDGQAADPLDKVGCPYHFAEAVYGGSMPSDNDKRARSIKISIRYDAASIEEAAREISQLLNRGEATIVEKDGKIARRLRLTKIGQARNKSAILEFSNTLLSDEIFYSKLKELLKDKGFEGTFLRDKRIYRRKPDLPDPKKPHWAEVNRTKPRDKKDVKLRLEPGVLDLVNEAAQLRGQDRTSWMTAAFLRAAQDEGLELAPELQALLAKLEPESS